MMAQARIGLGRPQEQSVLVARSNKLSIFDYESRTYM